MLTFDQSRCIQGGIGVRMTCFGVWDLVTLLFLVFIHLEYWVDYGIGPKA